MRPVNKQEKLEASFPVPSRRRSFRSRDFERGAEMVSAPILSLTCLLINVLLFASTFYQVLTLSDLEEHYINMYEAASLINRWIIPDFVLQGVLSLLLLVSGYWFLFLISVTIACYHVMLYIKKQHLVDITEIFRVIGSEKKYRLVKLGLLLIIFLFVAFRCLTSGHLTVYSSKHGELDIRSSILEF
ncbi:hypothetical protein SAY86_024445 [Trapa natans]|uniref:Uncharacterized protein n=1 Tax=Trapa natans TaxID=22666 RepID=A0AAN7M4E1_TRANT|nr:hypothetical protein SAY86_024445 [Trapa natans]